MMYLDYFLSMYPKISVHVSEQGILRIGSTIETVARIYATDEQLRQIMNAIAEYLNTKHPDHPDQQLILNAEHEKAIEEETM